MDRISEERLTAIRNDIDVRLVISNLRIPTSLRGRRVTFRCPRCGRFHTAVNPRANLARCFRCARSFNPIDLVMAERGLRFLETVRYLEDLCRSLGPVQLWEPAGPHPLTLNYRDPDPRK